MKRTQGKRLLSLLLALVMVLGMLPATALAAESYTVGSEIVSTEDKLPKEIPTGTEWSRKDLDEEGEQVVVCTDSSHTGHDDTCYTDELICGHDEGHNPSCYTAKGEWIECTSTNCENGKNIYGIFFDHNEEIGDGCWNVTLFKTTLAYYTAYRNWLAFWELDTTAIDAQIAWMTVAADPYKEIDLGNVLKYIHYSVDKTTLKCNHLVNEDGSMKHVQDCYRIDCDDEHAHNGKCYDYKYTWVLKVAKPEKPTPDEVQGILNGTDGNNTVVVVDCTNSKVNHANVESPLLKDTFTVGEVTEVEGVWTVSVTIAAESYVTAYDNHTLEGDKTKTITLSWDHANSVWNADPASVTFSVICNDVPTYTVTFAANGGKGTMTDQIFEEKVAEKLNKNTFTYDKHVFTGWKDAAGTSYADEQELTLSGNLALIAQWGDDKNNNQVLDSNETFTVKYMDGFGTEDANVIKSESNLEIGDDTPACDNPEKEGYLFLSWVPAVAAKVDAADAAEGTCVITYTATWDVDADGDRIADKYQRTLTFAIENGAWNDGGKEAVKMTVELTDAEGKYDEEGSYTVTAEDIAEIPAAGEKPDEGYKAGDWDVLPEVGDKITVDVTYTYTYAEKAQVTVTKEISGNKTSYAVGDEIEYKITVTIDKAADLEQLVIDEFPGTALLNGEFVVGKGSLEGRKAKVDDKAFDAAIDGDKLVISEVEGSGLDGIWGNIPGGSIIGGVVDKFFGGAEFADDDIFTFYYTATVGVTGITPSVEVPSVEWDAVEDAVQSAELPERIESALLDAVAQAYDQYADTIDELNAFIAEKLNELRGEGAVNTVVVSDQDGEELGKATVDLDDVTPPDISINAEKTAVAVNGTEFDPDNGTVVVGDKVTYEIEVTNDSSIPLFCVPVIEMPSDELTDGAFVAEESNIALDDLKKLDATAIMNLVSGKTVLSVDLGDQVTVVVKADWSKMSMADMAELVKTLMSLQSSESLEDVLAVLNEVIVKPEISTDSVAESVADLEEYLYELLDKTAFLNMTVYVDGEEADLAILGRVEKGETVTLTYEATVAGCDENGQVNNTAKVPAGKDGQEILNIKRYTVSYDANGGKNAPNAEENVLPGEHTLNSTTKPTHDAVNGVAVVFIGWTEAKDTKIYAAGDTAPTTVTKVTVVDENITVYAVYGYDVDGDGNPDVTQNTYTVTYDANGGTGAPEADKNVLPGEHTLNSTTKPTHDAVNGVAVVFIGWTEAKDTKIYAAGDTAPTTVSAVNVKSEDITVYSVYGYDVDGDGNPDVLENCYTVSYDANGGTGSITSTKHPDGAVVTLSKATFDHANVEGVAVVQFGWTSTADTVIYKGGDTAPVTITSVSINAADVTVYAVYGLDADGDGTADILQDAKYTVVYTDGVGGKEVFVDKKFENVAVGAVTPAFGTNPTREYYTFREWDPAVATYVTADATYKAKWTPINDRNNNGVADEEEYVTVTYTDGVENAVIFADQVYGNLLVGDTTPAFQGAPARAGYTFTGWDPAVTESVAGDVTYVAQWSYNYVPYYPSVVTPDPTVKVKSLNTIDHVAYIIGVGNNEVNPLGTITRAEVATIYFRLMTEEFRTQFWSDTNSYTDVADTAWYNVAVSTLEAAGIIKDTEVGGEFRPNEPITRAELAVMAAQFCTLTGKIPATSFKDVDKNHWAYDEIKLVEYAGWIEGYAGNFRPDDNLIRAECVTIINRMLQRGAEAENMLEDMATFVDNIYGTWYYEAVQEAANSHTYTRTTKKLTDEDFRGEKWTALVAAPDWAALEKAWSEDISD